MEHPSSNEKDASFKVDAQNWKNDLTILRQRLAGLEGATQNSSVGMAFFHNPTVFASSASSTWVIDSGATDNMIGNTFCVSVLHFCY